MRSINELNHTLKISINETLQLIELLEKSSTNIQIKKRLEEILSIFFHSKPNIIDYPIDEWKNIEEVFKFCMRGEQNESNRNPSANNENNS